VFPPCVVSRVGGGRDKTFLPPLFYWYSHTGAEYATFTGDVGTCRSGNTVTGVYGRYGVHDACGGVVDGIVRGRGHRADDRCVCDGDRGSCGGDSCNDPGG
jgi:hypothetical protein